MTIEVVGAGFGRTGTNSLQVALQQLGFDKCYHMLEVREHPEHVPIWAAAHRGERVDWDALYAGYKATVDWPSCNLWRELADYYPRSKVILTTRDPDRWYESVMNTIYPSSMAAASSDNPAARVFGEWAVEIIWNRVFDGRMQDKAHVLQVLRRHEAEVKVTIAPTRLLVFDVAQGWDPLCRFLGRPVPSEPFPRLNSTEDFRARTAPPSSSPA